jgi:uncharacterized membrane protein YfcA
MATQAVPRRPRHRRRPPSPAAVGIPLLLGIVYGAYTSFLARAGGPATFGQLALALASGVGLAVLLSLLIQVQHRLPPETRAGAWGVLVGCTVGFSYSLTGPSILRSIGMGLGFGLAATVVTYYMFHTRLPAHRGR